MINIFENYGLVKPTLVDFLDKNTTVMAEIGQRYSAATHEYKDKSGWAEQFSKDQQSLKDEGVILQAMSPYSVHLPKEELTKFRASYSNLAEDLKLTSAIDFKKREGLYFFAAGIIRPDFPETPGVDHNTIEELVWKIKNYLGKKNEDFYGANIVPFFYTVNDDEEIETEDMETLLEFGREFTNLGNEEIIKEINKPFEKLSPQEIEEFEKLYNS